MHNLVTRICVIHLTIQMERLGWDQQNNAILNISTSLLLVRKYVYQWHMCHECHLVLTESCGHSSTRSIVLSTGHSTAQEVLQHRVLLVSAASSARQGHFQFVDIAFTDGFLDIDGSPSDHVIPRYCTHNKHR